MRRADAIEVRFAFRFVGEIAALNHYRARRCRNGSNLALHPSRDPTPGIIG
jgi:hypothetical protein